MSNHLPAFSLKSYITLLDDLAAVGYQFDRAGNIRRTDLNKIVFLRHDVDLYIPGIEEMALREAEHGLAATYYVPLTQHFNPLYPENRSILKKICKLGHEIGLHYDLETYPVSPSATREHLAWEVAILSNLVEQPVKSICMHQPHKGTQDPFLEIDDYINPNDPRYHKNLLYVSDSCRAWRDENLLSCFGSTPPQRLLLTTHPELWLDGTLVDRMQYLDKILMENGVRQPRDYFDHEVRRVWMTHPAPRLHNERERRPANPPTPLTPEDAHANHP